MPIHVDTVTLLKLIHDSFALSKEKNDAKVFEAAQSLLSLLVFHLRHPMAEFEERHAETIRFLETSVARGKASAARRRRTGTTG